MTDAKTLPSWITGTVPVDANGEPFPYGLGLNPQPLTDIRDAEIARLRAALDAAKADVVDFSEIAAALVEEMSKKPDTTWGQVKAAIRALGDLGDRPSHRLLSEQLDAAEMRAQEATLDAIVSQGQAEEAHDARLNAEAERDAARLTALEDAAVKVESLWAYRTCAEVAAAIRAMKEPTK